MIRLYGDDVLLEEIPEEEDFEQPIWVNPNCRTCGAPLIRDSELCEYCGSKRKLRRETEEWKSRFSP